MTRDLLARLMEWTQGKVDKVNRAERIVDHMEARGIVVDACTLTLQGIRRWNPDGKNDLEKHLRQTIESRLYHDRRWRRAQRRHRDIDAVDSSDESPLEAEASLRADNAAVRPDGAVLLAGVRERVLAALRPLVGDDGDVSALLEAWLSGCEHRGHVMTKLGWTLNRFRNADRRMATLIAKLPAEVRESAVELVNDVLPRPWDMTRRRKHRQRSDGKGRATPAPAPVSLADGESSDSIDAAAWDGDGDPDQLGWDDEVDDADAYDLHDGDSADQGDEP